MFCPKINIKLIQYYAGRNKHFFGDGTFKRVPQPFFQLFTIHVDTGSSEIATNIVPAMFALLPNKTQRTYEALFKLVRDVLGINIRLYKCDYELGQINAFKTVFGQSTVTGCYYHFNKTIWKNAEDCGMTTTSEKKNIVRMTANLPLLSASLICNGWQAIVINGPACDEFEKF